jgi:succinate dehydrogenase / fumarate reductase flavoprotein subunit
MGKVAGEKAIDRLDGEEVELPGNAGEKTFSLFSRFMEQGGQGNLGQIREEMRMLMTEKVGVFRTEEGISQAIEALRGLKERADNTALSSRSLTMNQDLIQRWELNNLLAISMVTAQGALKRRESRGGHFREDFPERKDQFNYHTLAYMMEFGDVKLGERPIDMSIYEEKGEHYEKFGMIERKY